MSKKASTPPTSTPTGASADDAPARVSGGELSRRELISLGTTAALGGGLIGPLAAGAAAGVATSLALGPHNIAEAARRAPQVPRRTLGRTGQKIPILLMGGAMRFDPSFDPKLAECYRYGVNYYDVADCYAGATSEPALSSFLQRSKLRNKVWITSKSDAHDAKGFERTVESSLRILKTTWIDLYFQHGLSDPKYINNDMKKMQAKLKKQKKIRFFGFSTHSGNVVALLDKAAKASFIDVVMFRYNFAQYGNTALNKAIDACHKAGIGLIAMKTQASASSFKAKWKGYVGKWNKHQAVLKAVWADKRIAAAVSHMKTLSILRQNIGAALDKKKLSQRELDELIRYAKETRHLRCDGCTHICHGAHGAGTDIGSAMRLLSYHDVYGEPSKARELFRALPAASREIAGIDFSAAARACPNGIDLATHMQRAAKLLG